MDRLPLEIQTLYAELLEQLAVYEASRAIGRAPGSFVTKNVKGADYYYFQFSEPGGSKRQVYLGRRDESLDDLARRHAQGREDAAAEQRSIERLCSLLRVGGAPTTDAASARVLRALADGGLFRRGAVLVGTHAFAVLGNLLGVRWHGASLRTQDVDIAATRQLQLAVPAEPVDVPGVLEGLEMGFLPVPGLDPRTPSTSFKVRGKGLRIDLLTSADRSGQRPVQLGGLGAAAQPLKFMEYVLESHVTAAVVDGGATSVNVPDPARFALHKLIVANDRPAAMHAKRDKDLRQAAQVLEVLAEDRAGDVRLAWDAAVGRGSGWRKRLDAGLGAVAAMAPEVAASVRALVSA